MILYTIGTSKKNLRSFIKTLQSAGVDKVIDVRLNNTSQLAGYSKKDDLEYVLELVGMKYEHILELTPTEELLKGFKSSRISWDEYVTIYTDIMEQRQPLKYIDFNDKKQSMCLLCSEDKPHNCHRRLLAEYYADHIEVLQVKHL